ncbi:hypothetical protein RDI58_023348 [Solanum bulbocastanum]|uniref:RWP-RK domain-containing protein n=1 Tax=Solanum bulbocastanum TaxID=147425 RepID=A0AAN8Y6J2_SOLBU
MAEVSSNKRVLCDGKWITVQDIEEQYGKHRKEAAAKFNVSPATFRRKLRELGILRWPYPKRRCNPEIAVRVGVLQSSHSSSQSNSEEKETHFEEETTEMGDESKSISTLCIDNTKLDFNKLIASSLEDLSHPENETSMKKALSILSDNPSLFSKEQAEQIDGLLVDFPALVHKWREYYSRSQTCNLKSSDETENLVGKDHKGSLKVRYEELENKEKELTTQLMALQKQKTEIAEQRNEKSKQSKDLISMVEKKEKLFMTITTDKLKNLSDKWTNLTSAFIQ